MEVEEILDGLIEMPNSNRIVRKKNSNQVRVGKLSE